MRIYGLLDSESVSKEQPIFWYVFDDDKHKQYKNTETSQECSWQTVSS